MTCNHVSRKCIVTLNSPFAEELERYAERHGVSFCGSFDSLHDTVPHPSLHWLKMKAILDAFRFCHMVLWVDGDVAVTNEWVPLDPVWRSLRHADIAFEKSGHSDLVNNGIFSIRNSTLARDFLNVTYHDTTHVYPFFDNSAFDHHLRSHPVRRASFVGFNMLVANWMPGHPFLHFAGHGPQKNAWAQRWLRKCQRVGYSSDPCLRELSSFSRISRAKEARCTSFRASPSVAVATIYEGATYWTERATFTNHAAYAFAHGYAFCWKHAVGSSRLKHAVEHDRRGKPAHWMKLSFLHSLLDDYDAALWVDADAAFTRVSGKHSSLDPLLQTLDEQRFVALPWTGPRCRDRGKSFLSVASDVNLDVAEPTNTGCFMVNKAARPWLNVMYNAPATTLGQQEQLAVTQWVKASATSARHISWVDGLQAFPHLYAGELVVHPAGLVQRARHVSTLLGSIAKGSVMQTACSIMFPCLPWCDE